MRPMPVYFKSCNKDLAFLFNKYIHNLEEVCRDLFFNQFKYSARLVILDMEFTGFYTTKVLSHSGIPIKVEHLEWNDDSAQIYNGYKEIIKLWEEVSQYQNVLKFIGQEELFLKVLDNVDTLKRATDSKRLNWLMKVEEDFNVFKASKLIEGI